MSGLFDPAGINRGVSTGDQGEMFGDREIQVLAAAILDVAGVATLAPDITAEELTDLLQVNVRNLVDNGDSTYTVTLTDGTSFNITEGADALTGQQVIDLINGSTGIIDEARTVADVTPSWVPASDPDYATSTELTTGLATKQDTLNTTVSITRGGDDSGTITGNQIQLSLSDCLLYTSPSPRDS